MNWRSSQFGTIIVVAFGIYLLVGVIVILVAGDYSIGALLIFIAVPILVLLLFYKLDVSVDRGNINVKLGIGLISKNIKISDIESVQPVINSPFAGWGIRILPGYTMYNVTGDKAIEITFKGKKRKFRIGMEDPNSFVNAFNSNFEL